MSGHSKWATIKRGKAIEDIKRGKVFTKLARAISVAARRGGTDPQLNPVLRATLEKARAYNMPSVNLDRAIGAGGTLAMMEEGILEGYGPMGVAFLVKFLTDNRNRTLSELRRIFEEHGGRMGEAGSAAYVFATDPENPSFTIPITDQETARKILALAEALDEHDDVQEVYSNFDIPDELVHQLTQ